MIRGGPSVVISAVEDSRERQEKLKTVKGIFVIVIVWNKAS